jgi:predicted esterase
MNITQITRNTMELSGTKRRALEYPEPYIVPPRSGTHRQSFIILHGRGSEGEVFGAHLLMTAIPKFSALQDAFPDAHFIFPTASMRRAAAFGRTPIHQWFDNWSLQDPMERAELQYDGLRGSSEYVHQLLEKEIAAVGGENVVLWGLSQGMAISMISLLLWTGSSFAAAVGMCGWIPLKAQLEQGAQDSDIEDDNNPFGDSEPSVFAEPAIQIPRTARSLRGQSITCGMSSSYLKAKLLPHRLRYQYIWAMERRMRKCLQCKAKRPKHYCNFLDLTWNFDGTTASDTGTLQICCMTLSSFFNRR